MPATVLAAVVRASEEVTVDEPTGFFGALASAADWFIGLFEAGGEVFMGLVVGIIPTLVVLLTAVNALIRLIGPEKIDRLGAAAGRPGLQWYPVRYLVLPVLSVFFLTNPMAYTMGRFLPERYKPAFYDSAVSFVHPITGIFPHANPGELFVYLGIAGGVAALYSDLYATVGVRRMALKYDIELAGREFERKPGPVGSADRRRLAPRARRQAGLARHLRRRRLRRRLRRRHQHRRFASTGSRPRTSASPPATACSTSSSVTRWAIAPSPPSRRCTGPIVGIGLYF